MNDIMIKIRAQVKEEVAREAAVGLLREGVNPNVILKVFPMTPEALRKLAEENNLSVAF